MKSTGVQQFNDFSKDRLIYMSNTLDEEISKNNLKIFEEKEGNKVMKDKQQAPMLKNDCNIFSQLFISCQTREGNLDEFFKHETMTCPPSLSNNGKMNTRTKSYLVSCLEDLLPSSDMNMKPTCIILDGAVIVQMLKPRSVKTFNEYADQVFIPYISLQSGKFK